MTTPHPLISDRRARVGADIGDEREFVFELPASLINQLFVGAETLAASGRPFAELDGRDAKVLAAAQTYLRARANQVEILGHVLADD